jgi:hypothetical protein
MVEEVNDAILTESTDDPVLALLLELAAIEIQEERPLFPNPLEEPLLYRQFKRWVKESLDEAVQLQQAEQKAKSRLRGG